VEKTRPLYDLTGRVAFVTGGAVGIGRAIVVALAEAGAHVTLTYKTHNPEDVLKDTIDYPGDVSALPVDVTDPGAVHEAVEGTAKRLGRLDIVVANAGGLLGRVPLASMSDAQWHDVIETNLSSAFYLARAAIGCMRDGGGRLIFISSFAALNGGGNGAGAYAASKAGIVGLTKALAKEVAPRGINANVVAPGFIEGTPFHDTYTSREAQESAIARLPVGRGGRPCDVANAVLYLASDGSSFVTGTVVMVTGGQELT
jgi:3-oxoacyl-[acyl-carrier protein] reductase